MSASTSYWLQLSLADGLGPVLTRRLIDAAGGARAACEANVTLLRSVEGIGSARATRIADAMQVSARLVEREIERCTQFGITIVCPDDAAYPSLLRTIPDPPCALYVKGNLEPRDLNALAIVGSRKCSYYGREQAERFAGLLAAAGFTVISGGARGVDSSAHRGALAHPRGRTIAVLGSGIDVTYPAENAPLFEQIAAGRGAIVTEYPLGTPPVKENFPRRNRIVSGLSRGVLVIEADERSGALITARQAGEDHGRTVFALPGRVDNPTSAGPHQLIRDGAVLVTKLDDILEGLSTLSQEINTDLLVAPEPDGTAATDDESISSPATPAPSSAAAEPPGLTDRQRRILAELGSDPLQIDTLIERSALEAPVVMQELTFLSLRGAVRRVDGQMYVRTRAGNRR
jgi:DNA processing protein